MRITYTKFFLDLDDASVDDGYKYYNLFKRKIYFRVNGSDEFERFEDEPELIGYIYYYGSDEVELILKPKNTVGLWIEDLQELETILNNVRNQVKDFS